MTASEMQSLLAESLTAEHFEELNDMKAGSLWSDVPLWLWSPILDASEVESIGQKTQELCALLLELGMNELNQGRAACWLPDDAGLLKCVSTFEQGIDPCFNWRFDFLWDRDSDRVTFLEVNAGDPSGLGWVDVFTRDMARHSLWQGFLALGNSHFDLFESLHQATLSRLGRKGHICLISANSCTVASDIQCLGHLYRESGWQVSLVDPGDLEFQGEGCSVNGALVDVIFRDTYEELFWPPHQEVGERVLQAERNGKLLILNPLSAAFWDSKALWSELPSGLSTVPVTKVLASSDVDQLVRERENWVVKPSLDYGGRGVVCGYATEAVLWRKEVMQAAVASRKYLAQKRAPGGSMKFPFLDSAGRIHWQERHLTWSSWIHNGRFAGIYARASLDPVVNVHNGGAIFPVYQV